jgi:hypothetical protein
VKGSRQQKNVMKAKCLENSEKNSEIKIKKEMRKEEKE